MISTWFTADLHLGHRGIIQFDSVRPHRPFDSIEEHDDVIIQRWNETVRPLDNVWVLGDVIFGKPNIEKLTRLNGRKRLVSGNHDMYPTADYLRCFRRVQGAVEWKGLVLTHIPVHPSQKARFRANVHGHLHEKDLGDPWYINVSLEQTGLRPVHGDEILARVLPKENA